MMIVFFLMILFLMILWDSRSSTRPTESTVPAELKIGIDLDNTIVRYHEIFHRVAIEEGLIPPSLPVSKDRVRDHLRASGNEDAWTRLQGSVYGARMGEAEPFPGVLEFFRRAVRRGLPVCIISHKTRYPFLGPRYDLHQAALDWLAGNGFFSDEIGLSRGQVFLEEKKQDKLLRIRALECTHFIDDLPELLGDPNFPAPVLRWLFDPEEAHSTFTEYRRFRSWDQLAREFSAA
jgi:hypothetical protein